MDYNKILDVLNNSDSRAAGVAALQGLSKAQLLAVEGRLHLGAAGLSRRSKSYIVILIVSKTIGERLKSMVFDSSREKHIYPDLGVKI